MGSILKKYPIPAILLAERDGNPGTYEIIDELQRLHSIVSFIENAFPIDSGAYFDVNKFPTAKSAATEGAFEIVKEPSPLLSAKEVSTILDYTSALSVMRNSTDEEVNDVFDRINTYGHRLSDQERRQAGVQNEFSTTVRHVACDIRGDVSMDVLSLQSMPSISIDLPKSNHGYEVKAEDVFWVDQGVLRSTDLRDSLDEQYIADIVACIVGGQPIDRSKDALDDIGPKSTGKILIGVTDKESDAARIKKIDGTDARKIGKRYVVGVGREAVRMGISVEKYFSKWKDGIKKSKLTPALRDAVLSNLDYNAFYGLGVIVIAIPTQAGLSYVGDDLYWRNGDSTELATGARQIAGIAERFNKSS